MPQVIKIMNKALNFPLLRQEIEAARVPVSGLLVAGFVRNGTTHYQPMAARSVISRRTGPDGSDIVDEADPGELRFRSVSDLTSPQNAALNNILNDHDSTQQSTDQANKSLDDTAADILVSRFRNWGSLTNAQKDNTLKHITRLVARLLSADPDA